MLLVALPEEESPPTYASQSSTPLLLATDAMLTLTARTHSSAPTMKKEMKFFSLASAEGRLQPEASPHSSKRSGS